MAKCSKCGNELRDGQKFCMKCGTPVSAPTQSVVKLQPKETAVCAKCGNPLNPGQKFCMKCGTPVNAVPQQPQAQPGQKGWFTDGVRAVANAVTGGALNRDIERQQQQAMRQQARDDQGQIQQAQQGQQAAERAQRLAEQEAERARDRRNQEAIDGIDVVRGRAIWNIQPGQIARRITETEFYQIEQLKGVIIQEGCTALVYVDGDLVGSLSGGAYTFPVKSDAEKKAEREQAEQKIKDQERKKQETFMDRGLFGTIGIGLNTVRRFFFGNKKGENEQKRQARQQKVEKVLKEKNQPKLIRVYLVSDRVLTLTFGGQQNQDGGIDFVPFKIPTKIVDVEIGVSLQMQINNIHDFLRNYLADRDSVTTIQVQQLATPAVQNTLTQMLRNLDYQQEGLPEPIVNNLKARIQQAINNQLFGIQCTQVLQITDRSADFERFRQVERELFCSEKELEFLQRTGEFRNRLASETNKQTIDKATSEEELRYALQQLNKDKLLHDDEMEQFVLMLSAQKRLRIAKSQEEEYEALLDLKKSRLVKDDEMAALEDALTHNKIERDSVTEIMRIQHQQSVDDARLHAQWALDDQKQDHDWEREDLQRRRDWGIEDEQREREWMHEEQEYNRQWGRTQQQDEYNWQKRIRETDFDWQQEERRREADWQQRQREHEMSRQDKFDDIERIERLSQIQQRNMQLMAEKEMNELREQNRSREAIEINRDNVEANMSAEQLMAKRAAELSGEGQVAFAQALGSGKENELLKKQAEEADRRAAKDKEDLMNFAKEMAGMIKDTATSVGGAQLAAQKQRADEYREDAQRQQDRMDHTLDQSLNYTTRAHQTDSQSFAQAMGGTPQNFQQMPPQQPQQPVTPTAPATPQVLHCPACGAEVPEGEAFCGECGQKL